MDTTAVDAVTALLNRATEADGIEPFSEAFVNGISDDRLGHRHLTAEEDGEIVGIVALDGATAELVVDPAHRRAGHGRDLLSRIGETPVWAHGNLESAQALAADVGLVAGRTLYVMSADIDGDSGEELPEGFTLTDLTGAVERFGREQAMQKWLDVNNEAFSWHPEQGGWDMAQLERATEADWFDDRDVLLLFDGDDLAGFHWMKRHDETLAETYVVGLASSYRGRRLGGPLMRAGLDHVAREGATRVILYVESDNVSAVKAYKRLGFTVVEQHVLYS